MQPPTCYGLRLRTLHDAHVIFHAVNSGLLRMVTRRLDSDERRGIASGCIYVWEERGATAETTGLGIERWTDSIPWGPSRVRDEFLYYKERRPSNPPMDLETTSDSDTAHLPRSYRPPLHKQTYSVFVETDIGRRKWHLIAYFTEETLEQLCTVDDHPAYPMLSTLRVPFGMYKSARITKTRRHHTNISAASDESPPENPLAINPYRQHIATLAPLIYLSSLPPRPRHVLDQLALNSLPIEAWYSTDTGFPSRALL